METKLKHTTAGWTVNNHRQLGDPKGYEGAYEIAEALSDEHAGNQQLIQAAPDLLAACEELIRGGWHNPDCAGELGGECDCGMKARYDAASAAIAKAKGETK